MTPIFWTLLKHDNNLFNSSSKSPQVKWYSYVIYQVRAEVVDITVSSSKWLVETMKSMGSSYLGF